MGSPLAALSAAAEQAATQQDAEVPRDASDAGPERSPPTTLPATAEQAATQQTNAVVTDDVTAEGPRSPLGAPPQGNPTQGNPTQHVEETAVFHDAVNDTDPDSVSAPTAATVSEPSQHGDHEDHIQLPKVAGPRTRSRSHVSGDKGDTRQLTLAESVSRQSSIRGGKEPETSD